MKRSQFPSGMHCGSRLPAQRSGAAGWWLCQASGCRTPRESRSAQEPCMTRTGHTEPCPPVILPVPVHSFINKSTLVPGQSPTIRSSLLWNCHDSKCPGLWFYISSEQRGQQKVYCPLIHCRDIDSAWV